jgi:hypothetical protein
MSVDVLGCTVGTSLLAMAFFQALNLVAVYISVASGAAAGGFA